MSVELVARLFDTSNKYVSLLWIEPQQSGSKALSMACYLGHMDIVSMVLVSGACIEGKDNKGNSPIHFAIKGNQPEVLASLLSLGADVNATNKVYFIHFLFEFDAGVNLMLV